MIDTCFCGLEVGCTCSGGMDHDPDCPCEAKIAHNIHTHFKARQAAHDFTVSASDEVRINCSACTWHDWTAHGKTIAELEDIAYWHYMDEHSEPLYD